LVNIQFHGFAESEAQSSSAKTLPSEIYNLLLNILKKCKSSTVQFKKVVPLHQVGLSVKPHAIVVFVLLHNLDIEANIKWS